MKLKLICKGSFEKAKFGNISEQALKVIEKAEDFDVLVLEIQEPKDTKDWRPYLDYAQIINENMEEEFEHILRHGKIKRCV